MSCNKVLLGVAWYMSLLLCLPLAASFSVASPSPSAPSSSPFDFRSFEFDPTTGICRKPASFRYSSNDKESQYFVLRNVPGDGDCVFYAVLESVFISMGMLNPDASSSLNNSVSSMALEMRKVVANFLSSPDGTLYVSNKPRKRIVRCRDLLESAAKNEGLLAEEYLTKLRQPGKQGGLYGGGPELTVLSNILRRPISIFHINSIQSPSHGTGGKSCELQRMGVFGEGLFEDPGQSVPDSVVTNAVFFTLDGRESSQRKDQTLSAISSPLKCSWHIAILIADAGQEKHACVLLPSVPILHNRSVLDKHETKA